MTLAKSAVWMSWRHACVALTVILAVIWMLVWWLNQPASKGTIVVTASTGSLVLEVMCGEQLIWDLPPGQVLHRSLPPGSKPKAVEGLTLTLTAGARVNVLAQKDGALHMTIESASGVASSCRKDSEPSYRATDNQSPVQDDPMGIAYSSAPPAAADAGRTLELRLYGHVRIGQAVQQGAGWSARSNGILESGTVALRVVPVFSKERITLSSEHLDEGSLLDTHACLDTPTKVGSACPSDDALPAQGFLRTSTGAGLQVQLYTRGPVGMLAFGSAEQQQLTVPNLMAAWRSTWLTMWGAFLGAVVTFWKQMVEFSSFVRKLFTTPNAISEWLNSKKKRRGYDVSCAALGLLILTGLALGLAPVASHAEPVEIKQDSFTGSGYSFRRGTSCLVVTAQHVVKEIGVPITVLDRTGAKASGSRTYSNEAYDLALITLPDTSTVACTTAWPDTAWLRRETFGSKSEFRAIRHYPGGQEVIVYLKHAGGSKDHFTLAPVDAVTIRESDSGSIVAIDEKLVGIVQSVATDTHRVTVLRLDRIDDLIGDRFRGGAVARVVSFAGVFQQNRPNANWGTYVQSWITEKTGRTIVPASTGAANSSSKPVCDVKVDVVSWDRANAPNPERDALEFQEKACNKKGALFDLLCKQAKTGKTTAPTNVLSQKVSVNVIVTPPGNAQVTKLVESTYVPPNSKMTPAEIENATLRAAVGPTLTELFERGGCN